MTHSEQMFKLVVLSETGAIPHLPYGLQKHEWNVPPPPTPNISHQCSHSSRTIMKDKQDQQQMINSRSYSAYFDKAFSVNIPRLWNDFPADIKKRTSINKCKRELKQYLLQQDALDKENAFGRHVPNNQRWRLGKYLADVGLWAKAVFGRMLDRPRLSGLALLKGTKLS